MNSFTLYKIAEQKLNEGLIRVNPKEHTYKSKRRLETMNQFLKMCNNPQEGIQAIHVTGTSGKGSVCSAIAGILKSAGFKVGLHTSPYLQSATEKIWIDGHYISGKEFHELMEWVWETANYFLKPETPTSIHGMAQIAICLEAFKRACVDIMIFEAGCGGRFDLSSVIETQVAVITNVGMDHINTLGPTIDDIAWHKAGIARPEKPVITGASGSSLEIIKKEAQALDCPLTIIPPKKDVVDHNIKLAQASALAWAKHNNHILSEESIKTGVKAIRLPGRMEKMPHQGCAVYLDGAHNGEKLTAAIENVIKRQPTGKKIAVLGMLGSKATASTIKRLSDCFNIIIITEPKVYGKTACQAFELASLFKNSKAEIKINTNPEDALDQAFCIATPKDAILITGSFYLCGQLRQRWYSKRKVVENQNSWF